MLTQDIRSCPQFFRRYLSNTLVYKRCYNIIVNAHKVVPDSECSNTDLEWGQFMTMNLSTSSGCFARTDLC